MKSISIVKEFGKTTYGSLTFEEFKAALSHPFLFSMKKYLLMSHVMVGDYKQKTTYTYESESYISSSGQNHPAN